VTISNAITREIVKMFPETRRYLHGRARWVAYATAHQRGAMKSFDDYKGQIYALVTDLFEGVIIESDFVDGMADIIPGNLTDAWNEGMSENGLDPDEDMLPEWQDQIDAMILSEYDYVDGFAAAIAANAGSPEPNLDAVLSRADLWAQRYTDVYNEAKIRTAEKGQRFVWEIGSTEENCWICKALNGIVAFAFEWEEAGFRPQEPPNDLLSMDRGGEKGCGGWRCDCSLTPTNKRRTQKALDRLMNIAQGAV
jgi:hypothetical protein